MIFPLLLAFAAPLDKDPLCAEPAAYFREELGRARTEHAKAFQFRNVVADQDKWLRGLTDDMRSACDADAKFAAELAKKDRSALTGQCKPAAEAALADQEVLDYSETAVAHRKAQQDDYFMKGVKGGIPSLWAIFEKDHALVQDVVLFLEDVPREGACELQWMYPKAYLKKKDPFPGCPESPKDAKIENGDRKDPGVFARLFTRLERSATYNAERRDRARATALASRAKYEACIAKFPGTENVLLKAAKGKGAGTHVPKGASKASPSTITGIEEDREKQKK